VGAAEAATFVRGLPVRLQDEVADEVADREHGKDLDPRHAG
jgi:hypothetical protein